MRLVAVGGDTKTISTFDVDFESEECGQVVASLVANLNEELGEPQATRSDAVSLLNTVRKKYNPEGKAESPSLRKDVYPVLRKEIRDIRDKFLSGSSSCP